MIGASPDAYVHCDCCGGGVIDVKCPYSFRGGPMGDYLQTTQCCMNTAIELKVSHAYYFQVQVQMFCSDTRHAEFVLWTPIDCIMTRVERNDIFHNNNIAKMEAFWFYSGAWTADQSSWRSAVMHSSPRGRRHRPLLLLQVSWRRHHGQLWQRQMSSSVVSPELS